MNKYSELFRLFEFDMVPASEITADMAQKVANLGKLSDAELTEEKVLDIINEIVYGSLATDFAIATLEVIREDLAKDQLTKG